MILKLSKKKWITDDILEAVKAEMRVNTILSGLYVEYCFITINGKKNKVTINLIPSKDIISAVVGTNPHKLTLKLIQKCVIEAGYHEWLSWLWMNYSKNKVFESDLNNTVTFKEFVENAMKGETEEYDIGIKEARENSNKRFLSLLVNLRKEK